MIPGLLKNKISVEFYKFIVVGAWSTIINYGIFYILLEFLSVNYLTSSAQALFLVYLPAMALIENGPLKLKRRKSIQKL